MKRGKRTAKKLDGKKIGRQKNEIRDHLFALKFFCPEIFLP